MHRKKTAFLSNQIKIYILPLLCTLLFTISCKDNNTGEWNINNGNSTIIFDGSTFDKEVSVKSDYPWEVVKSSTSEWIQPTIKENSLVLLLAPNSSKDARKGNVLIKNRDGKTQMLNIEQKPANLNLKIVSIANKVWLNYHQTEYTFYIYSKTDWTISSNNPWLTTDISSGPAGSHKIVATFDKNTNKDSRKATVTLSADGEDNSIEIAQRGKKDFEDVTYKFYTNIATLPTLYAGLMIMNDEITPSYLIDKRGTLNKDKLPNSVTNLSYDDFPNNMINIIRDIEAKDPEATYAYYGEDLRVHEYLPIFTRLGIDTSRVKLTLLPDGARTYTVMLTEIYGKNAKGGDNFKTEKKKLDKELADYTTNPSFGYNDTKVNKATVQDDNVPHVLAQYHHVRYIIEDLDYLITHDNYVQDKITENNYVVLPARKLLDNLSLNKQNEFYDLTGFDMQANLNLLTASSKPNIIILGTNTNSASSPEEQGKFVQTVMNHYSSEYDIFFKAHPADKAYLDYESKFPGLKLITPATMPFDVFTWALDGKIDAIGGYTSTIFLTVPTDKVKFMFAKDAESLGGELFENIFKDREDIYWIQ